MSILNRRLGRGAVICGALCMALTGAAAAADFIVAVSKPNRVFLIDAAAQKVVVDCEIPGRGSPTASAPNSDGSIVYILTNGWGEVSGMNMDTCEEVFHTNLSEGNIRAKSIAGIALSRDETKLFVVQSRVELLSDRYNVIPKHRIAVYSVDAGLDAKPERTFDVPRGISIIEPSVDGKYLWAFGHDIMQIEIASGDIKQSILLNNWEEERPTYGDPDGLSFWPLYGPHNLMITPYFAPVFADREARDAVNWDKMTDFVIGLTTIDLEDNTWTKKDITSMDVLIFSFTVNPKKRSEAFGVYTQLSKYDLDTGTLIKRVDLDHTYYATSISTDGETLFIGGTNDDVAFYSTETLEKLGEVKLPGGGDQGVAGIRVVQR